MSVCLLQYLSALLTNNMVIWAYLDSICGNICMGLTPGLRAEGGQGQSQEKWRAEGGRRRAEGGHWTDHEGLWRTAEGEKFLLRFSTAEHLQGVMKVAPQILTLLNF